MSTLVLLILIVGVLVAFGYAARPEPDLRATRRVIGFGLGGLTVVGLAYHFRALLPPFGVPLLLAYLLDPVLDRLERAGHSRVKAIGIVYATLLLALGIGGFLVVPPVVKQVGDIVRPLTSEGGIDVATIQDMLHNQEKLRQGLAKTLLNLGVPNPWVLQLEQNYAQLNVSERLSQVAAWLVEQLQRTVGWLAGQVSSWLWVLLLPITLFYFLRDFDPMRRRLYYLIPPAKRVEAAALATEINHAMGSYLRGYALLSLSIGVLETTLLLILTPIFQFKYGLLLGLLAGVTYFIPYIGSLVGVILTTLVVYFTGGHSLVEAGVTFLLLQGINSTFDNVLTPRVIGQSIGLHPLLVMFALLAGGAQFGLVGVIVATPVTVCVKIVLEHFCPRLTEAIPAEQTPEAVFARRAAEQVATESDADDGDRKEPEA